MKFMTIILSRVFFLSISFWLWVVVTLNLLKVFFAWIFTTIIRALTVYSFLIDYNFYILLQNLSGCLFILFTRFLLLVNFHRVILQSYLIIWGWLLLIFNFFLLYFFHKLINRWTIQSFLAFLNFLSLFCLFLELLSSLFLNKEANVYHAADRQISDVTVQNTLTLLWLIQNLYFQTTSFCFSRFIDELAGFEDQICHEIRKVYMWIVIPLLAS